MAWSPSHAVLIGAGPGPTPRPIGTGFVAAAGKVVTARSVITGAAGDADLRIRWEGGAWQPVARVTWRGGEGLDLAVLDAPQCTAAVDAETLFEVAAVERGVAWFADGYPGALDKPRRLQRARVGGEACACPGFVETFALRCAADAKVGPGLLGAAVVIGDRVKGVVARAARGDAEIAAVPAIRFVHEPAFRAALGLPRSAALAPLIATAKRAASAALARQPTVLAALAERLGCPPADAIDALFGLSADDLVATAVSLHGAAASAIAREAVGNALAAALSVVEDLHGVIGAARALGSASVPVIELATRASWIAEVVASARAGRPPRFELCQDDAVRGATMIPPPSTEAAPFFSSQARLDEATLEIVRQLLMTSGTSRLAADARRRGLAPPRIAGANRREERQNLSSRLAQGGYYFLLVDVHEQNRERAPALWAMLQAAMSDGLEVPLLRSTGRDLSRAESNVQVGLDAVFLSEVSRSESPEPPERAAPVVLPDRGAPGSDPRGERMVKAHKQLKDSEAFRNGMAMAERRVCRVLGRGHPYGTGFLVSDDLVLTAYHVIAAAPADGLEVEFDHRLRDGALVSRRPRYPIRVLLDTCVGYRGSGALPGLLPRLDYAFLMVEGAPGADRVDGTSRGFVEVVGADHALVTGSDLTVLQHPRGAPLKFDHDEITAVDVDGTRVMYTTNTDEGSSGSPCFDAAWRVVAMHVEGADGRNCGVPLATLRAHLPDAVARRIGWK